MNNAMRKLALILSLIFAVTLSSPSYAEWTKIIQSNTTSVYVDFSRMRKRDGYIYFWRLGVFPSFEKKFQKSLIQADCKTFKFGFIVNDYCKYEKACLTYENKTEWEYASPQGINEDILKNVCNH